MLVIVPGALDRAWTLFPVCYQRHDCCNAERVITDAERVGLARKWLAEAVLTPPHAMRSHALLTALTLR